jgi:hypothetical protein
MAYVFNQTVKVPVDVINQMGQELINNTVHELLGEDLSLVDSQVHLIKSKMEAILHSICHDNGIMVEGYVLDRQAVDRIAKELHNFRKIEAIKQFRAVTGAGLRESKDFIDKFGTGQRADVGPSSAVKFKLAFQGELVI